MTLVAGCGASALSVLGNEQFVGLIRRAASHPAMSIGNIQLIAK